MAGFWNDVLYATNVDFTGTHPPSGKIILPGQLLIGAATPPYLRAGFIACLDGSINVDNQPGMIYLSAQSLPFQEVSVDTQMLVNNCYVIISPGGIVNMALPIVNVSPGNSIEITNINGGGIQITQSAGQSIFYAGTQTTVGTSGYMQSITPGASIILKARQNTNNWYVVNQEGSFTGN